MNKPYGSAEIVRAVGMRFAELRLDLQREIEQAEERRNAEFQAELAAVRQQRAEMRAELSALRQEARERILELKDGANGRDGADGRDGEPGERGPEGPTGKLPIVRAWTDSVHYEGAVVTHGGSTWQAQRDTGREPPHEDWICLACGGSDGRSFAVRGTWVEGETYRELDVVALGGASFAARRDDPGICPGDGWQLIASQGKRGNAGERGAAVKGERGEPGAQPVAMDIDDQGLLTLRMADGSMLSCDLYPLLVKLI